MWVGIAYHDWAETLAGAHLAGSDVTLVWACVPFDWHVLLGLAIRIFAVCVMLKAITDAVQLLHKQATNTVMLKAVSLTLVNASFVEQLTTTSGTS